MEQMLRPLCRLRKVGISLIVAPDLERKLLCVLGASCPQLRQLEIFYAIALEHQLKSAAHLPTFPRLQYLGVRELYVGEVGTLR